MLDKTLIVPDSGPDFLKTLRMASLYSEEVHVFTLTNIESATKLKKLVSSWNISISKLLESNPGLKKKFEANPSLRGLIELKDDSNATDTPEYQFLQFSLDHADDLKLLSDNNILHSVTDAVFAKHLGSDDLIKSFTENATSFLGSVLPSTQKVGELSDASQCLLAKLSASTPPSLASLLEFFIDIAIDIAYDRELLTDDFVERVDADRELISKTAFGAYLLAASYYSISEGISVITWNPEYAEALSQSHEMAWQGMPNENPDLAKLGAIGHRLGQLILEEEVPNVSGLPFEEILNIRRRRQPELEAFRVGLRQMAADIDPTQDRRSLELAINTKIARAVKPALRELNAAVSQLQLEAYKKLCPTAKEFEAAVIPAVLSLSLNPTSAAAATLGAAGLAAFKLYEFLLGTQFDKKKILASSPWSLIYRLQQKK